MQVLVKQLGTQRKITVFATDNTGRSADVVFTSGEDSKHTLNLFDKNMEIEYYLFMGVEGIEIKDDTGLYAIDIHKDGLYHLNKVEETDGIICNLDIPLQKDAPKMDYYMMAKKEKPWYEEKKDQVEAILAFRKMKEWELDLVKEALRKGDQPLDILQDLWRQQRMLLAILKEEDQALAQVRGKSFV